ncbi:MAG: YecH family protein [Verrucomicrobiales bacterium]|nr:YecH family protein [Verrucomicrobiales bacterium]MCP5527299.1 YecH family protein [Verrucomicrobiales bacterium]
MIKQVHGHEVLEMMVNSGRGYTRESLRQEILDRFGPEARFHTCSAEGMSADELIEFLAARGKFVDASAGFRADPARICNH